MKTNNLFGNNDIKILVYTWFLFSGLAALIYQVLWARQLELLFGTTLYAISTILSVFMAGLALGSYLFGRIVDKSANPLRLYAILEGIIGLYALLTPFFFWLLPKILVTFSPFLPQGSASFSPVYFFFSFILLILPTTLMGGTLPILSKFLVASRHELGQKIGNLYFINTLGAAIGTFLAGFILIFFMGTLRTTAIAALINLAVGLNAYLAARKIVWAPSPDEAQPVSENTSGSNSTTDKKPEALSRLAHFIILVGYGLAGFAALGLEVQWTKVLTLMIGSSVYAFSLMLSSFLVGIALGSFVMAKFVDGRKNLWRDFAIIEILLGLSILVLNPVLGRLPYWFLRIFEYRDIFWQLQTLEFSLIFLIMLIPTLLMGAAFPVVSKIYTQDLNRLGNRIGQIYAANTIGSIIGPLAVSFLFIPLIGLQNSILLTSAIYVAVGMAVLLYTKSLWLPLKAASFAFLILVFIWSFLFIPRWNKLAMTSGVFYHATSFLLDEENENYNMLFYKEGQMAVVTVLQGLDGNQVLLINGKVDASTHGDLGTQLLSGHLPMLLHENPKKAFLIGLASGITLGAILQHPELERVDVAELEPAVTEAAATFASFNNNALSNPRARVFTTDARNYILTTKEKYDVIAAEPSNPWVKGSSTIFSRDVFQTYRDRLNDDGIVMQWVQLYRLRNEDLKTMINTFRSVFPHTTLWSQFNYPDLLMIGTLKPLKLDIDNLKGKLQDENVKKSLSRINSDDLYTILSFFQMDEQALARYVADSPINTDDRPIIEYTAPKGMYLNTSGDNWESMKELRTSALALLPNLNGTDAGERIQKDYLAREIYLNGEIYNERGQWNRAVQSWEEAWKLAPLNGTIWKGLAYAYQRAGDYFLTQRSYNEALEQYELALDVNPNDASVYIGIGDVADSIGQQEKALVFYHRALGMEEQNPYFLYKLASFHLARGENQQAMEFYSKALEINPAYATGYINRGRLYAKMGEYDKAINDYSKALSLSRPSANHLAYLNRGWAYYNRSEFNQSIKDYDRALKIKKTAEAYDLRALSYMGQEKYRRALKDLDKALSLNKDYDVAYYHRYQALTGLGRRGEALESYEKYMQLSGQQSQEAPPK